MDERFDGLARAAATMPRRHALKLFAGSLGAAILSLGPRDASAIGCSAQDNQACAQGCRSQYPGGGGHCVIVRGRKTCQCLR